MGLAVATETPSSETPSAGVWNGNGIAVNVSGDGSKITSQLPKLLVQLRFDCTVVQDLLSRRSLSPVDRLVLAESAQFAH